MLTPFQMELPGCSRPKSGGTSTKKGNGFFPRSLKKQRMSPKAISRQKWRAAGISFRGKDRSFAGNMKTRILFPTASQPFKSTKNGGKLIKKRELLFCCAPCCAAVVLYVNFY